MKMKYIWNWEWKWEDRDKGLELDPKFSKAMEENPDQFPKMLTNTCFTGRGKGFRLIEADNDEQLANLVFFWSATEKWKLEPYLEFGESVSKAWQKWVG
jgi:hypothetical protein